MKARILVPVIGASLALIGPATHAAGARNALHCAAATKGAHTAATAQKPFFSPLNPRGLLAAQAKACVTKQKKIVEQPKPKPKPPVTVPAPPSVAPTFPATPSVGDPYCLVYLDYPDYESAPCVSTAPSTAPAPALDAQDTSGAAVQATQDTSGEPPLADVDVPPYYFS